jgi:hypothetical protein
MSIPTLKDLQAEFIAINPKKIKFVGIPTLRIPYPVPIGTPETTFATDQDDYWQWIGYIEDRGQELAKAAVSDALPSGGIKAYQEPRYAPEHKCWRLWIAVTWYEDLYCTLTGKPKAQTLMERDRTMSAIVARVGASAAAKAVPTLKDLKAEYSALKGHVFVNHPVLGIPHPTTAKPDTEDYDDWIRLIERTGKALAKAANIKTPQDRRYFPEHPLWRLWLAVTWYEDLYCTLTETPKAQTLTERDRDMSAIVSAAAASEIAHRERAHAEDVETLRDLLDAKDREIAKLKAALASLTP